MMFLMFFRYSHKNAEFMKEELGSRILYRN